MKVKQFIRAKWRDVTIALLLLHLLVGTAIPALADMMHIQPVSVNVTDHGSLGGLADDDHIQYLLASGARVLAGSMGVNDDTFFQFGGVASLGWETADADANALVLALPEAGEIDSPIFIIGDQSILNADLAKWHGISGPAVAIYNAAADAYLLLSAADDYSGLFFHPATDETITIVEVFVTGTPSIWWDEDDDDFGFNKGLDIYGDIVISGTVDGVDVAAHDADGSAHQSNVITITYIIDGGGSAITTGEKGHIEIPFACTITGWTLLADQSGSIVIDVWKDTCANFPPTVADTITGSEKPTLSAAQENQDLALGTWTTAVSAGDILAFNIDSASTVERITLSIRATKT